MSSSRRSSTSSTGGLASPQPPPELVLVNEVDFPNEELDFSSDDEMSDDFSARLDRLNASTIPPLSPTLVLLYLSVPYLKSGPMFLAFSDAPLSHTIPTLIVCALFAALTRQMWYLLAKYLRKTDTEEVILDILARGGGKARTRFLLRVIVRAGTSTLRILLASVYLRASVDALLPFVPSRFQSIARELVTSALALSLLPLYAAPSLAAKRIIFATLASLLAYLIWLGAVLHARIKGTPPAGLHWESFGILWQGITSTAFVFSSSWTLPLYAALRGSVPPTVAKRTRRRSFRALIAASVAVAVALVLPFCLFALSDNLPSTPGQGENALVAISSAANLILNIPAILITIPTTPLPRAIRRTTNPTLSKIVIYVAVIALSALPSNVTAVLGDALLVLSLLSTYVLPAILHITVHYFKRPLSIVLPTSLTRAEVGEAGEGDELLRRKERSLQRKRLGRRLAWDVIAWALVLPIGAGGCAWAVGRALGRW
ncbi:hypothetical protein EDB83DRAFT_2340171 [Lactarius deliciosus]|nr:hypothetical protein EDB83DRAFT_2340171 [Lactarius deliciosus]